MAVDYFAANLCSAGLRWLTDNSCSFQYITGMQSICIVSRYTVSDSICSDCLHLFLLHSPLVPGDTLSDSL